MFRSKVQAIPDKCVLLTAVGIAIIALCLLSLVCFEPASIVYHKGSMNSHWDSVQRSMQGAGIDADKAMEEYEHHRDRLVDLGYLVHMQFDFPDRDQSAIGESIWDAVRDAFPDHPHVTLDWPENMLDVWCQPDEVAEWEAFIHDLQQRLRNQRDAAGRPAGRPARSH